MPLNSSASRSPSRLRRYGTDRCSGRPLPAGALEEFVVARLTEATADGALAERVQTKLTERVAKERATFAEVRKALAAQIAEASAATSKLTDEVVRLDGRARGSRWDDGPLVIEPGAQIVEKRASLLLSDRSATAG